MKQNTEERIGKALLEALKGLNPEELKEDFYYDYIYLPVLLYSDLISFERTLHHVTVLKKQYEDSNETQF